MATERLSMRKTREILRHKWFLGRGYREVARSVGVSLGAVWLAVPRTTEAGLDWPAVEAMDDAALEAQVHTRDAMAGRSRPVPDCARIDIERRRLGVTLELLHLEYVEEHPDGYSYTQFCKYYRRWLARQRLSMRQNYRAGEKAFVDYSGKRPAVGRSRDRRAAGGGALRGGDGRLHPSRPRPAPAAASLCSRRCPFRTGGPRSTRPRQRPDPLLPLAGFQVIIYGRFGCHRGKSCARMGTRLAYWGRPAETRGECCEPPEFLAWAIWVMTEGRPQASRHSAAVASIPKFRGEEVGHQSGTKNDAPGRSWPP
jgi:hypothetical protein